MASLSPTQATPPPPSLWKEFKGELKTRYLFLIAGTVVWLGLALVALTIFILIANNYNVLNWLE